MLYTVKNVSTAFHKSDHEIFSQRTRTSAKSHSEIDFW